MIIAQYRAGKQHAAQIITFASFFTYVVVDSDGFKARAIISARWAIECSFA